MCLSDISLFLCFLLQRHALANLFDACTVFGCQITWRLGLRCQGRIFPGSFANQCRPKLSPVNRTVAQGCLHLNQTKKYHQHTIHGIMCQNRNRCLKSNLCHTWPSPVQHWHKHLSGCWNGETSITNRFRSFQPVGGSRDCFGSCHRTIQYAQFANIFAWMPQIGTEHCCAPWSHGLFTIGTWSFMNKTEELKHAWKQPIFAAFWCSKATGASLDDSRAELKLWWKPYVGTNSASTGVQCHSHSVIM